jgi:hypothetical protein
MNTIKSLWSKIPAGVQKWLKGAEVAIVSGVVSSLVAGPNADFSTKAGWTKFILTEVGVMGGCLRLYMAQSPLQNVLTATETKSEITDGDVTVKTTQTNVVTGGPTPPAS